MNDRDTIWFSLLREIAQIFGLFHYIIQSV
jgi:hypothetical protein